MSRIDSIVQALDARRLGSGWRAACPACGGKRGKLSIGEGDDGRVLLKCFGGCELTSIVGAIGLSVRDLMPDASPTRPVRAEAPARPIAALRPLSTWAGDLWASCEPLGGVALVYLRHRCCAIPPARGDLRWHPNQRHPCGHVGPALVARLTDALTGEPRSLHYTWLRADGLGKAAIESPRRLLGQHDKRGTVCRLWPDDEVTHGLGIAEGIESALTLAHGGLPVWACIDAGNLGAFPVLAGIEALTVAVDNDKSGTGDRAFASCAGRWTEAGREVYPIRTSSVGTDINDMAMEVAA